MSKVDNYVGVGCLVFIFAGAPLLLFNFVHLDTAFYGTMLGGGLFIFGNIISTEAEWITIHPQCPHHNLQLQFIDTSTEPNEDVLHVAGATGIIADIGLSLLTGGIVPVGIVSKGIYETVRNTYNKNAWKCPKCNYEQATGPQRIQDPEQLKIGENILVAGTCIYFCALILGGIQLVFFTK